MSGAANDVSPSECGKEEKNDAKHKEEQNETLNVKKELLEEFPVEKQLEPKTVDKQKEGPLVEQFKGRIEGDTIRNEIRSTYQKLLDVKEQVVDTEESKNILAEAKNLILRVKGSHGASQDIEMYDLLCHAVKEMSKVANTDQGKFHVEDNALTIKFAPVALDTTEVEITKGLSHLPNELVMYIFLMLSLEDKKKAVLLNKRLGKVGENPVLWRWCVIKINCGEDINKLSLKRFLRVQEITVRPYHDWPPKQLVELFKATLDLLKLKKIVGLSTIDLTSVNSELLATALSKLEDIVISQVFTTNDQRREIIKQIAEKGLTKNLTFDRNDLRPLELDAGVLAKAMSIPQELELRIVDLTCDQAHELFKAMLENNRLKTVSLVYMDLSSVEDHLFGAALGKLEAVCLCKSNLTKEQVRLLFTELSKKCKLNCLNLSCIDLSNVDSDVLAIVVNQIGRVVLVNTRLKTDQISAILTKVQENSRLKRLDLFANKRIWEVDPALLEKAKEIIELDTDDLWEEDESDEEDDGSDEEDDGSDEEDNGSDEEADEEDDGSDEEDNGSDEEADDESDKEEDIESDEEEDDEDSLEEDPGRHVEEPQVEAEPARHVPVRNSRILGELRDHMKGGKAEIPKHEKRRSDSRR